VLLLLLKSPSTRPVGTGLLGSRGSSVSFGGDEDGGGTSTWQIAGDDNSKTTVIASMRFMTSSQIQVEEASLTFSVGTIARSTYQARNRARRSSHSIALHAIVMARPPAKPHQTPSGSAR
jgi:hypothetical protein